MKSPLNALSILAFAVAAAALLAGCYKSKEEAEAAKGDVTAMTAALKSTDKDTRINACIELAKAGPRAAPAVQALIPLLKDPDPTTRQLSAHALGQIGPKAAEA